MCHPIICWTPILPLRGWSLGQQETLFRDQVVNLPYVSHKRTRTYPKDVCSIIAFCIQTSLSSKHLEYQDLHSKASKGRDVLELRDPRSSIGVQNLINNACLIMILFAFFTFLNRVSKCQLDFILVFLAKLFLLMRSCIFKSSSLCFYYAFTHHFPLSETLKADLP